MLYLFSINNGIKMWLIVDEWLNWSKCCSCLWGWIVFRVREKLVEN